MKNFSEIMDIVHDEMNAIVIEGRLMISHHPKKIHRDFRIFEIAKSLFK